MIFQIPMIASEKLHQNLTDYYQFLFKNRYEVNKKQIFSSEKMTNSGKQWTACRVKLMVCGY